MTQPPAPALPSAGRYLLTLTVGASSCALTTPALAATETGKYAKPHGEHNADFVPAQVDSNPLSDLVLPDREQRGVGPLAASRPPIFGSASPQMTGIPSGVHSKERWNS